ncbi:hypothetical protein ANCDUO_06390 [Ancylostoma duodenale]|uniref:Uncharacterized protein n=1 Tax=Ancylostoma duodenale TaxID=51022 RepID=A0A0C2DL19_9BILA|nr:hypothetical protein ANCDUO_06390 [Ancylostoma duodenale]
MYWELLAERSTVTADVYIEQLRNLKANLGIERPQQHEVYLQNGNDGPDFQIREGIKEALEQLFKGQSSTFWSKSIYDLPKHWQKTIDANEAYNHKTMRNTRGLG